MTNRSDLKILNYTILNPRVDITLDIWDAELYEAAIIVQPLIGNLVYYSNKGRYEPRLAKKWSQKTDSIWEFELYDNIKCENGEPINAQNFKDSLERTIKRLSIRGPIPVLNKLDGYDDFTLNKSSKLDGIIADDNKLIFKFKSSLRSGLVQILSFTPFGYICKENINDDGTWKDNKKIVSSGPFKVSKITIGKEYVIEKNPNWKLERSENSADIVKFGHVIPNNLNSERWIIDTNKNVIEQPKNFVNYLLVPEYLCSINLGNLEGGFFSDKHLRKVFRSQINRNKNKFNLPRGNFVASNTFYPNQDFSKPDEIEDIIKIENNMKPVVIQGSESSISQKAPFKYALKILIKTLNDFHIPYRFSGDGKASDITNQNYDIRIAGSSIGGGVEVWGIGITFCSNMGIGFPDPTDKICNMVTQYENNEITYDEFSERFFETIKDDSALLPIGHFGSNLFLSKQIKMETLNPTLNVIKFDQLGLD